MSQNLADQTLTLNKSVSVASGMPLDYVDWVTLTNHSPFALSVQTGNGSFVVPAWYYYPVQVHDAKGNQTGVTLPLTILPYIQTIPGSGFTSVLNSAVYMKGETPPSTIASPLGGGPVDLTIASSIINTDQPPGNSVVFAKPVGDTSVIGAANLNNQGQLTLGDATYNGSILIEGTNLDQISLAVPTFLRMIDSGGNLRADIEPGIFNIFDSGLGNAFSLNTSNAPQTVAGSVAGSVTFYAIVWGVSLKIFVVDFENYNSVNTPQLFFPSAIKTGFFAVGNCGASFTFGFLNVAVAQTSSLITTLGGAGAGVSTGQNNVHGNSLGQIPTASDRLALGSTAGVAITTNIVFIGV